MTLLEVEDLHVAFPHRGGPRPVVEGVGFSLDRGGRLGIVGESGSGKSLTARAVLGVLPQGARWRAGALRFDGQDLTTLPERGLRALRGRRMAMVMQDPRFSLNPIRPVGWQIAEALRLHRGLGRAAARDAAKAALSDVAIPDPDRVFGLLPGEISGGMAQRAMIAMMLAGAPDLLIADEPTSALDVTVAEGVMTLFSDIVRARGASVVLITHDIMLARRFCDEVLVMRGGRVVERLPSDRLSAATDPYTRMLIDAALDPSAPPPADWPAP